MALHVRDLTPYYLPRDPLAISNTGNKVDTHGTAAGSQGSVPNGIEGPEERRAERQPCITTERPSGWRAASSASFDMDGLFLLTGENMAGKSTLCRSTLALALLANAGEAHQTQPKYKHW